MTQESNTEKGMSNTNGETGVLHPSITATIEKEPVRIMIDTGASSSYICTEVITKLNLKPIRREPRNIEQMYGTVRKIVEIYKVTLQSQIDNGFSVEIECINAEKDVLTTLPIPNIKALKERLPRLRRLSFTEESNKGRNVPIHIILGVGDYQQIRTSEPLIFGSQPETDPVAEFTKLGWTLFGGKNCTNATQKQFLLTTGQEEFERLCSLDVLGITGNQEIKNEFSHENFKDQIRKTEKKILGIQWDKRNDQLEIKLDECFQSYNQLTKRGMVSTINSVYDILGWASPIVIVAKLLFSQVCKLKLRWDEEVPKNIADKWKAWIRSSTIDQPIPVPRAVITRRNHKIELHGFSDASKEAVCATIYVVEYRQGEPTLQNLLVAKSRESPTDTSIPRLELVAAQMLAKLSTNVMAALSELDTFTCYYWTDSTTVLHWMANKGTWSVFIRNRGPSWLARQEDWPDQPEVVEDAEAQTERIRTKLMVTKEDDGNKADVTELMNCLLSRHNYSKLMRITAYVLRFVAKCRGIKEQGPLNSAEYRRAENTWIKITQQNVSIDCDLMKQEHDDGIWYVNGRIVDYQPILLPKQGQCREQPRKRWLSEYLRALEERHRRISGTDQALPTVRSVVLLADNVAIKPKWTLGRIVDIVRGRDHVIRGFKIKNVNGYICERPI
eukprot:gene1891-2146_t